MNLNLRLANFSLFATGFFGLLSDVECPQMLC